MTAMTARRTKLIKESGPYKVDSCRDGSLTVQPNWPRIPAWDQTNPDIEAKSVRMALAREIEDFLDVGTKER